MLSPKISIIIPTFNRNSVLRRSILSVIKQTYLRWELWIVDDGGTEYALSVIKEILEEYPTIKTKIKYIRWEKNRGVSFARNRAIEASSGEWISFLDSDDEWLEDKLERQIEFLQSEQNQNLKVIHADEIWIRNGVRVNPKKKHQKQGGDIFIRSLDLCLMSPSTILIHKKIFEEMGLFREDYPVCEDYDLWLKITAHYNVGFVPIPIIKKYGGHEDQLSQQYRAMDYWRVKTLGNILKNSHLDITKKIKVGLVGKRKCEILIKGMEKHGNTKNILEVQQLYKVFYDFVTMNNEQLRKVHE